MKKYGGRTMETEPKHVGLATKMGKNKRILNWNGGDVPIISGQSEYINEKNAR